LQSQDLTATPEDVANLKGDAARSRFVNLFKEVQRLNTQLEQYTDLSDDNKAGIEAILPKDQLQSFEAVYLETAKQLKEKQDKDDTDQDVQQLDFEFVLFASAIIDYDYIMALLADYSNLPPDKQKMSRAELISLIQADAKFINDSEDIAAYIDTLKLGEGLSEQAIRDGFERFKNEKHARRLAEIAAAHGLDAAALQNFVDAVLRRMIFDGEALSDLLAPLELGWRARNQAEQALMVDLIPLLHKLAQGREISGLAAYES